MAQELHFLMLFFFLVPTFPMDYFEIMEKKAFFIYDLIHISCPMLKKLCRKLEKNMKNFHQKCFRKFMTIFEICPNFICNANFYIQIQPK